MHFSPKYKYVTDLVEKGKVQLYHIKRGDNGADLLTHSLPRGPFEAHLLLIFGQEGVTGLLKAFPATSEGGDFEIALLTINISDFV